MKKVLALVVALSVVAAYVFAQEAPVAKINGKVESGFLINSAKLGKNETIQLKDQDDSGKAIRAELGGSISTPDYGVVVNLRAEADDILYSNKAAVEAADSTKYAYGLVPTFQQAYAYANFFNKMLVTKAGILTELATSTNGDKGFLKMDPQEGMSINVNPIAGLAIDWLVPLTSTEGRTIKTLANSTIAAKYTMDKVFDVAFGFVGSGTSIKKCAVAYGFDLLAVANLSFNAEGKLGLDKKTPLADSDYPTAVSILDEKIGYTIDKLGFSLLTYQLFTEKTANYYLSFKPGVSYDLGVAKLGASFKYTTDVAKSWDVNANATIPVGAGKLVIGGDLKNNNKSVKRTDIGGDLYTSYEFTF